VCPLTLSRGVAARLFGRPFRWPSILRNKWLPAGLFVFYLWSYEILELWDRPGATAAWIAAFFVLCFLVEGLFQRGTFCRHICPVGQFQFIHSGLSPGEVQPLSKAVCSACTTHDCLRGNADGPGCPTELFLPAKSGNMDCTFCLDCVRACPHQNAALVPVVPGKSLGQGRVAGQSSGLDAAVLSLVFVCGAFVNAMFMSAPFMTGQRALSAQLGLHDSTWLSSMSLVSGMVVVPLIVFPLCAGVGRRISGADRSIAEMLRGFAPALVPLGFAMWLAHLGFHFMTGVFTGVSAGQRAMHDLFSQRFDLPGIAKAPGLAWIADFQLWALGLGLVLSIAVLWRVAREFVAEPGRALRLVIPWSMVAVLLWGLGVFIVLSPMAMRGTVM
jgi:NAD-dependent dihydropyrimidine dehydrogenase PreA subunit